MYRQSVLKQTTQSYETNLCYKLEKFQKCNPSQKGKVSLENKDIENKNRVTVIQTNSKHWCNLAS